MSSTDLVRVPVAIPPSLREAGVQVVEQSGVRMITGLEKMASTHNILQPINEIAQADPEWSPRIVEVHISPDLDPPKQGARFSYAGRHVYVQDKMLALNKNAILLLAKAAGITVTAQRTRPDPIGENGPIIEYTAFAKVRNSDGTLEEWDDSREKSIADERDKVMAQCTKDGRLDEAYFLKRWATEKDFLPQKVRSMAMLRVVSSVLSLKRGGYTEDELRKPFLVIAWSSTPTDPEVRREIALAAAGVLYGRRARPEIEAPETDDETEPVREIAPPADVVDHIPATAKPSAPQEPDPNPIAGEIPPEVAAALEVTFPRSLRAAGKKIREVREEYVRNLASSIDEETGEFVYPKRGLEGEDDQYAAIAACRVVEAWRQTQSQVSP